MLKRGILNRKGGINFETTLIFFFILSLIIGFSFYRIIDPTVDRTIPVVKVQEFNISHYTANGDIIHSYEKAINLRFSYSTLLFEIDDRTHSISGVFSTEEIEPEVGDDIGN